MANTEPRIRIDILRYSEVRYKIVRSLSVSDAWLGAVLRIINQRFLDQILCMSENYFKGNYFKGYISTVKSSFCLTVIETRDNSFWI